MDLELFILATATCLTGLMAGIFFTWTNAVKPGISKLTDLEYLRSFQSMNRVILNIPFKVLFIGAILFTAFLPLYYIKLFPSTIFWLSSSAFLTYWMGVFAITVLGNIPLNEILDKSFLDEMSPNQLKHLRKGIEDKWNKYNLIRTVSSVSAFVLLILSYLLESK